MLDANAKEMEKVLLHCVVDNICCVMYSLFMF